MQAVSPFVLSTRATLLAVVGNLSIKKKKEKQLALPKESFPPHINLGEGWKCNPLGSGMGKCVLGKAGAVPSEQTKL